MTQLLFVHALSPLHAGTGHAVGAIDLPIARDRATGFPYLPGSSIKGVLRDVSTKKAGFPTVEVFGPDRNNASDHAGALIVGDANLLLLPVRSIAGTFAWATSPFLLQRFVRDARAASVATFKVPVVTSSAEAFVSPETFLITSDRVVFEDLDFKATKSAAVAELADALGKLLFHGDDADEWRRLLRGRLCILHDDAMAFLAEHGTDVVTRIAIDPEKKTVKTGALWTEESLPTESVLVSLVAGQSVKIDASAALAKLGELLAQPVQLGGNATVGRGRCQLVLAGGRP